jgi:hypothetical protein
LNAFEIFAGKNALSPTLSRKRESWGEGEGLKRDFAFDHLLHTSFLLTSHDPIALHLVTTYPAISLGMLSSG